MTTDGIERIRELFEQAIALPPAQRAAFLAKACGADHALLREVSSLIEHDAMAATEFLNPERQPVGADPARAETIAAGPAGRAFAGDGPTAGRLAPFPEIEGFQILRELHRGGQGVVYEAHDKVTKRKVAIKILIEGQYASRAARRRFEREIELVASLKHPNIVAVFQSGRTNDGRQFFVMDYVRGVPIDQYVRSQSLSLEDALRLFATVCEAVSYAHQKGVMHRDLKPANILVDSLGNPRVLDFGLAKLIGAPEHTVISLTGQVVGTLPYMSPEQARGNPDEIDTRTDIYALGVILYEILTGQYPYPVVGAMVDVLQHIAKTPPTPPSRAWKADSGVSRRTARHLRAGRCPIDKEVEAIVLRALHKDRQRRYQSVSSLQNDVQRYLEGMPIEARMGMGLYLVRKAVVRAAKQQWKPLTLLALVGVIATWFTFDSFQVRAANRRMENIDRLNAALYATSEMEGNLTAAKTVINSLEALRNADLGPQEDGRRCHLFNALAWAYKSAFDATSNGESHGQPEAYLEKSHEALDVYYKTCLARAELVSGTSPGSYPECDEVRLLCDVTYCNIQGTLRRAEGNLDASTQSFKLAIMAESELRSCWRSLSDDAYSNGMQAHGEKLASPHINFIVSSALLGNLRGAGDTAEEYYSALPGESDASYLLPSWHNLAQFRSAVGNLNGAVVAADRARTIGAKRGLADGYLVSAPRHRRPRSCIHRRDFGAYPDREFDRPTASNGPTLPVCIGPCEPPQKRCKW